MAVTRFLCDLGGELQVGPVHKHPAARLADVCHLGQCARRGPAWLPAAPDPHPLCRPGVSASAVLSQPRVLKRFPTMEYVVYAGALGLQGGEA